MGRVWVKVKHKLGQSGYHKLTRASRHMVIEHKSAIGTKMLEILPSIAQLVEWRTVDHWSR
jgi:hypothetical protein